MESLGVNVQQLILGSLIMVFGSALQASVGFGIALFVVPLLVLLNPALVPGPMLFASLILTTVMALRGWAAVDRGNLRQLFIGLFLGTVAGAVGLTVIAAGNLPMLFGLVILAAVVSSIIGMPIPFTRSYLIATGVVSGVMGTMTGIHGPPLALLYQRQTAGRVRATLAFIFTVAYAGALVALYLVRLFGTREIVLGLSLAPGVVIGYLVSLFIGKSFDRGNWLRMAILVVATLSALKLLWGS
jgi:uncharacterized membrane protein YfcA